MFLFSSLLFGSCHVLAGWFVLDFWVSGRLVVWSFVVYFHDVAFDDGEVVEVAVDGQFHYFSSFGFDMDAVNFL